MRREVNYIVPVERDGVAVKYILRHELNISAALMRRMKQCNGAILKNNQPVFVTAIVNTGDKLTLLLEDDRASENIVPVDGELDIKFENEDVLVVSKPGDMPVHPSQGHYMTSLANIVVAYYKRQGREMVFRPVNRLDRGTSGLMVIAKNAYAHAFFAQQMQNGKFFREYLAICDGVPTPESGVCDAPIARKDGSTIERVVDVDGKSAITHYRTVEIQNGRAIVRLRLETGRTHQIRVHMAHLGAPLVGDFLYGTEIPSFPRVALHSALLETPLPFTNEILKLEEKIPDEMLKIFIEKN